MDEQLRRQHLELLRNPPWPSSSIAHDYWVLARDLPPRRTLRERVGALARWRRAERAAEAAEAAEPRR